VDGGKETPVTNSETDLCVVGGGPAGMMCAYLFARAGLHTIVLEKHGDFLRDFRGDTVHPSTLDLFDELGLFDALLERPHDKVETLGGVIGGEALRFADFRHLPGRGRFAALMPQWEFLDFLSSEARKLPAFSLRMECEAVGLVHEQGRVVGVRTRDGGTIRARLTIAADGRSSILRKAAGLPLYDLGAPIDVFWFRVPKEPTPDNRTQGFINHGQMLVAVDRRLLSMRAGDLEGRGRGDPGAGDRAVPRRGGRDRAGPGGRDRRHPILRRGEIAERLARSPDALVCARPARDR